jgi:hypothetical protein
MFRKIQETLQAQISQKGAPIALIIGMRQVGKSTLAINLAKGFGKYVRFNFDLLSDIGEFSNQDRHSLALFAERYAGSLVVIDEVQKSPESISIIKHLYDNFQMPFILTGSSEIKLRKGLGDSLAGRIHETHLYPLTLEEIRIQKGEPDNYDVNQKNMLNYLIYGSLPNLLNIPQLGYEEYLNDYVNTIISKDVLEIAGTRKSTQVFLLAKLLALQIGQLVNFNELAINTEFSRETVYRYLDIFEQMGLIIKAKPISTNQRESISKATKIYFTDLGVRNSLVGNFQSFNQRIDKGQILENAVFVGIKKRLDYNKINSSLGFFRSVNGKEIDIVEKNEKTEKLYEVKNTHKKSQNKTGNIEIITLETGQKYL